MTMTPKELRAMSIGEFEAYLLELGQRPNATTEEIADGWFELYRRQAALELEMDQWAAESGISPTTMRELRDNVRRVLGTVREDEV
jgi:ribosomal protein L29